MSFRSFLNILKGDMSLEGPRDRSVHNIAAGGREYMLEFIRFTKERGISTVSHNSWGVQYGVVLYLP